MPKIATSENNLGLLRPELIEIWSSKNDKTPFDYICGSNKKVWWKCKEDHPDYEMMVQCKVVRGHNCPRCSGKRPSERNNLGVLRPDLIKEWGTKNNKTPFDYTVRGSAMVWWKCLQNKTHPEYQSTNNNRTNPDRPSGCPYCSGKKICETNNLAYLRPEIAKEWGNNNENPASDYSEFSNKVVWWKCLADKGHPEYASKICSRTRNDNSNNGTSCPYCAGQKVCETNSLAYLYPEIAKEWGSKNKKTPEDYTTGATYKAWWKCSNPDHPEYQTPIHGRTNENRNNGCPYCSNKKICDVNNIGYLLPELIPVWGSRNIKSIYEYTKGSTKKVWWKCLSNKGHPEYFMMIDNKIGKKQSCPLCKRSKGEEATSKYLDFLDFEYESEKRFKDCIFKKELPFDFYVHVLVAKDVFLPILIEYQGEQHFKPRPFFGGEKKFKERCFRDQIKRRYARSRGIPLLEIRYDEEVEGAIDRFIERIDREIVRERLPF